MARSFHLPDEPEQVFECQSAVMAGLFDAVTPHMVIGGTVSGQIVLWDRRVGETNRYPVIKTPLTAQTHTDPVYAISQVGGRETEIGGSGGSLEPPGPLLTTSILFYMVYSECLPTRLNPLAERTCFSQVGGRNQEQKLISASTDGRVCVWDLKKMQEPTAFYKLQARAAGGDDAHMPAKTSDLSVMVALDVKVIQTPLSIFHSDYPYKVY
jgi:hypothetical protein